jgi:hypothetical protein
MCLRMTSTAAAAFSLETPELGELLTLVVSHNSKGRRPSWFLHGVELAHLPSNTRYSWRVAAWYVLEDCWLLYITQVLLSHAFWINAALC